MNITQGAKVAVMLVSVAALSACGGGGGGTFLGKSRADRIADQQESTPVGRRATERARQGRSTFTDLFTNQDDPNTTLEVNRYLWAATLDVLSFMPVQNADPFSGIIQFGYGTPPGGGRAYQATVYVQDPALDARSLNVALRTRGGPVSGDVQRSIEDAILTRARQLRIADSRL